MEVVTGANFLLSNGFDPLLDKILEQHADKWLSSEDERLIFEEAMKFEQKQQLNINPRRRKRDMPTMYMGKKKKLRYALKKIRDYLGIFPLHGGGVFPILKTKNQQKSP